MGFDLHLAPAEKFLEWDDRQWDAFWNREPPAENEKLGNSAYVGLALDAVSRNLDANQADSRFPLLMRLNSGDFDRPGWHPDEVAELLAEVVAVKEALTSVPVNRSTLGCESDEDVHRCVMEFQGRHAGRAPVNLYDLYQHFLDTFESFARRAVKSRQGILSTF